MLRDEPRQVLCTLVKTYGPSLCEDPRRCGGLLHDFCSACKAEIAVLLVALDEGVATDLQTTGSGIPVEIVLGRLTRRLQGDRGLSEEAARWAVESWALALGVLSSATASSVRAAPQRSSSSTSVPPARPPSQPAAIPPAVQPASRPQPSPAGSSTTVRKWGYWKVAVICALLGALIAFIDDPAPLRGGTAPLRQAAPQLRQAAPQLLDGKWVLYGRWEVSWQIEGQPSPYTGQLVMNGLFGKMRVQYWDPILGRTVEVDQDMALKLNVENQFFVLEGSNPVRTGTVSQSSIYSPDSFRIQVYKDSPAEIVATCSTGLDNNLVCAPVNSKFIGSIR